MSYFMLTDGYRKSSCGECHDFLKDKLKLIVNQQKSEVERQKKFIESLHTNRTLNNLIIMNIGNKMEYIVIYL